MCETVFFFYPQKKTSQTAQAWLFWHFHGFIEGVMCVSHSVREYSID